MARLKKFPIGLQLPRGISPALLPEVPFPTKIRTAFQPPIQFRRDPECAEEPGYVQDQYERVSASIQGGMDALKRKRRLPVFG